MTNTVETKCANMMKNFYTFINAKAVRGLASGSRKSDTSGPYLQYFMKIYYPVTAQNSNVNI